MAEIWKVDFSTTPPVWEFRGVVMGRGWAYSIARPWVSIIDPDRHIAYLLPFLSYLAGSRNVSARQPVGPGDPDTMTNTAVEAVASSSDNESFM